MIEWFDLKKDGWPNFMVHGFHTGKLVRFRCEDGTEHVDIYQGYGIFGGGDGRLDVTHWAEYKTTEETDPIRKLPEATPRVETGPVQFGEDWPGTFFRGDCAGAYAFYLDMLLTQLDEEFKQDPGLLTRIGGPLHYMALKGLLSVLKSSRV